MQALLNHYFDCGMYTIHAVGIVRKPLKDVFEFMAQPSNGPMFTPNLIEISNVEPRDVCLGQEFDWQFNMLGVNLDGHATVTTFRELKCVTFSAVGDGVSEWTYEFEEVDDGNTKLSVIISYDLSDTVWSKFQNKFIIERINKKIAEQMLDNVKSILEK